VGLAAGMAGKAMPCPPLLPRGPIGAVLSLVVKEIQQFFYAKESRDQDRAKEET